MGDLLIGWKRQVSGHTGAATDPPVHGRTRPCAGEDKAVLTITEEASDLWWVVDQEETDLCLQVASSRNLAAAQRRANTGDKDALRAGVQITDRPKSDGVAQGERMPRAEDPYSREMNNRVENAHRPPHDRDTTCFPTIGAVCSHR